MLIPNNKLCVGCIVFRQNDAEPAEGLKSWGGGSSTVVDIGSLSPLIGIGLTNLTKSGGQMLIEGAGCTPGTPGSGIPASMIDKSSNIALGKCDE